MDLGLALRLERAVVLDGRRLRSRLELCDAERARGRGLCSAVRTSGVGGFFCRLARPRADAGRFELDLPRESRSTRNELEAEEDSEPFLPAVDLLRLAGGCLALALSLVL